jgi:hypothetical protein
VRNCTGTPGIGISNVDRAYSNLVNRSFIEECNVGMLWVGRCQDSKVTSSQIIGNTETQVRIGDGVTSVSLLTFENCQIERLTTPATAVTNMEIQGATQLCIRSCYLETSMADGSWPVHFPSSPLGSIVQIDGGHFRGNSTVSYGISLPADDTQVNLFLNHCRFVGFLQDDPIENREAANKVILEAPNREGKIAYNLAAPLYPLDINGDARVNGLVLTAPGGQQYRVTVDDAGNLVTAAV